MTKRIYYDATFTGLVPVKQCTRVYSEYNNSLGGKVKAIVAVDTGAYKKGEVISDFAHYFVNKLPKSGIHIMVKPAHIE